jgi:hypothetical protein
MHYVVTIALDHNGASEGIGRAARHIPGQARQGQPGHRRGSPGRDDRHTFAVEAGDGYEAFERGRAVFAAADTTFARPVVAVSVELAD